MEVWKDVLGYEGYYQVSNLGNVKSLKRKGVLKDRMLKSNINSTGYHNVNLARYGRSKVLNIHQLVAVAFLDHTPNGHKVIVDHIDNDRSNNILSNLQLITQRENTSKDRKNGTSKHVGVHWHKAAKKWSAVIRVNGKQECLGRFACELEAAEAYREALIIINNK